MNNQRTYLIIIYLALFAVTLGVTVLLFVEYRYFKREAFELVQVKEAYYQHVEMLKRSLNASMISSEDAEDSDSEGEKKKINEEQYTLDFSVSAAQEPEPKFQVISDEEESRLREIKSGLSVTSLSKPSKKVISRRKKISRRSMPRIVRHSTRYAPVRDFVFSWPVDLQNFWLSSLFGPRKRPNGHVEYHHGIDMAAMKGTPVKAAATGKVIIAGTLPGYGNCVMIEHNNRYKTRYGHMNRIHVRVGQVVQVGQQIGTVGDTGLVRKSGRDASHLHFEIYQDGRRVNPLAFLFS